MRSLTEALLAVHDVLTAEGVVHALCGGLAANLYRDEVRATMDIDLYVDAGPARLVALAQRFAEQGWIAEPSWRAGEQLRLTHPDMPRADCLIAATDYERVALRRAVVATIEGRTVPVLASEDLIVFKLVAGRARDYEAVAAMLNTRTTAVDAAYVAEVLARLGFEDRWARAQAEAARERGPG